MKEPAYLKGSRYIVFDFIADHQPITMSLMEISEHTGYALETVRQAVKDLRCLGIINAQMIKTRRGPYTYEVKQ